MQGFVATTCGCLGRACRFCIPDSQGHRLVLLETAAGSGPANELSCSKRTIVGSARRGSAASLPQLLGSHRAYEGHRSPLISRHRAGDGLVIVWG